MTQDNFSHFESLKAQGYSPEQAYLEAEQQGLDFFAQIRMLRAVYQLSLPEAKEVMIVAHHQPQDSSQNKSDILNQYYHNLVEVLESAERNKNWDFSLDDVGQWYWKSYSAANGNFKTTTSTTSYATLADCFANATANGYDGGVVTETEVHRVKQLFKHNQHCSPEAVVYEDGDWYNYHADEGSFEKVDEDSNVFEIDSEGTLTYWGKSWQLAGQEEVELSSSHTNPITLNFPPDLVTELSIEATQEGLSLPDYVLQVLVTRPLATPQHSSSA
jgi:hypothetical protein